MRSGTFPKMNFVAKIIFLEKAEDAKLKPFSRVQKFNSIIFKKKVQLKIFNLRLTHLRENIDFIYKFSSKLFFTP